MRIVLPILLLLLCAPMCCRAQDWKAHFQLLLSTDTAAPPAVAQAGEAQLQSFLSTWSGNTSLSAKDLKRLYSEVHRTFFKKYEENPPFTAIFTTGTYNCATATALYALVLDRLSVPYSIQELPTHVYLVAAPGTANVIFETTAPGAAPLRLSPKMKSQYLQVLYENKLISGEEWSSADKEALFQKHYFSRDPIGLKELAGLLHYNRSVALVEANEGEEAIREMEKAYALYGSEKVKLSLVAVLLQSLLGEQPLKGEKAFPYHLRVVELSDTEAARQLFGAYFSELAQELLFRKPAQNGYLQMYHTAMARISDTTLRQELQQEHWYNMGHLSSIRKQHAASLRYLDSLISRQPENLKVHELVEQTLVETIIPIQKPAQLVDTIRKALQRYPFLSLNSRVGLGYVYGLSQLTDEAFTANKKDAGDRHLDTLRGLMNKEKELAASAEPYFVAALCARYAYHMRNKQYKEAKAWLQSVLPLYPQNEELTRRMETVNRILLP